VTTEPDIRLAEMSTSVRRNRLLMIFHTERRRSASCVQAFAYDVTERHVGGMSRNSSRCFHLDAGARAEMIAATDSLASAAADQRRPGRPVVHGLQIGSPGLNRDNNVISVATVFPTNYSTDNQDFVSSG